MADNKYKIFRNFMMNELQITRDDIFLWTKEAIAELVPKLIKQIDVSGIVYDAIKNYLSSFDFKKIIREECAKILLSEFNFQTIITQKQKKEEICSIQSENQ